VFGIIAASRVDIRSFWRSASQPQSRSAIAINDDWPALLSAIAEQQVNHRRELDALGICSTGNREIKRSPAETDLDEVGLIAAANSGFRRARIR
jgi:hypothetical protein